MRHSAIIIGTGFSGLAMAIALKKRGVQDFIILEKAQDVGGTWRENTYPGAECDIPSALYSFSFEPYPYWEYKWSMQPQILEYIQYVAKKYDLYPHIQFGKELTAAQWQEQDNYWQITTKDSSIYESKILITAIGQLHHPSTPNFRGKDSFAGDSFHSAQWNHDVDLQYKTIGVIGNAASAVQFIPEIAKVAKQVVVFQRSANWMLPKQDRAYKEWEKKLVARFPILLKTYRKRLGFMAGALFLVMKNVFPPLRKLLEYWTKWYIKRHIKDPVVAQKLIPTYPLGAKRVLFSDTYYQALARPNVELLTGGVQEISSTGVVTGEGDSRAVDVLVYATGFKANPFLLGIDLQGRNGTTIQTAWEQEAKNYLGITTTDFPNFFMLYGPNTNLGHNSIILMAEAQAEYIAQAVEGIVKNKWQSMEVKPTVLEEYYQSIQQRLKTMIWATIENSWYKSASGDVANNFPGRTMEYARLTRRVDFADFEIKK
ncbi:MAG: flavin-containing monooxygenase [Saprospiraceae bacterium]